MINNSFLSTSVLVTTAGILFYAALTDLKHYRIPNELIVVLGILYFAHAGVSGQWTSIPWNVGLASVIFGFLLWFYALQWVGGGDVKMLTVAFLWTGIGCALPFHSVRLWNAFGVSSKMALRKAITAGAVTARRAAFEKA